MHTLTVKTASMADLNSIAVLFNQYRQFYEQGSDLVLVTELMLIVN